MGNILFPMSSLSNMVNYDRDILLDKLLQRLQIQNKKITDLRIRLLQLKLQSTRSNQGKRHYMRSSRDSRDDAVIENLEKILNQRFQINPIAQNQHKSLSERFNSLNLMRINEWQKDHNTCNYHYQYNQCEHMNPRLNFHTIRNKDRYGSIVASSDSFSWNEQ